MMLNAYSVFDNKALQYYPPFFASTDGAAIRNFSDLANDPNTNVGRHPADYILYCIGTYDDNNGRLQPHIPLNHVVDAIALIQLGSQQHALFNDVNQPTQPATNGKL